LQGIDRNSKTPVLGYSSAVQLGLPSHQLAHDVFLASKVANAVGGMVAALADEIKVLESEVLRIGRLATRSEVGEREKALASVSSQVETAVRQLEQIRRQGGWAGLGAPIKTGRGWWAVRHAHSNLAEAEAAFEAPEAQTLRAAELANHNQYVTDEHARVPTVQRELDISKKKHLVITRLQKEAQEAIAAAKSYGWAAYDFSARFREMARQVHAGNISGALQRVSTLVFQRKPAVSAYINWGHEATALRNKAYSNHAGMAASGSFPEIASRSIDLAKKTLHDRLLEILESYPYPADQWQVLSALLLDPRHLKTDALWAIYWSMFQCGQWMANALFEADAHEDIFNGQLSAQIDRWLGAWAAERIPQFGYPETMSYMGTLQIASTGEETRLGADIGLIIDLNIGNLVCRKVALFQAKKAKKGSADVGSDTAQLPKLAAQQQLGFYLFYHQLEYPLFPPAPTVASAHELAKLITQSGRSPDAASLTLNIRATGWDWASFVSFGLCEPDSPWGETFDTASNALDILGGGNQGHLPKYLHVIAITEEPRVLELRAEISEHYRETLASKSKERQADRGSDREIQGPSHGMGM
jgi:hypothetical protein